MNVKFIKFQSDGGWSSEARAEWVRPSLCAQKGRSAFSACWSPWLQWNRVSLFLWGRQSGSACWAIPARWKLGVEPGDLGQWIWAPHVAAQPPASPAVHTRGRVLKSQWNYSCLLKHWRELLERNLPVLCEMKIILPLLEDSDGGFVSQEESSWKGQKNHQECFSTPLSH